MTRSRIRRLFRFPSRTRTDVREDVREELSFHIDMRAADLVASGVDPQDARDRARREFGDVPRASASLVVAGAALERRRSAARLVTELAQDTRYALRLIGRNKGFAIAAILTVAACVYVLSGLAAITWVIFGTWLVIVMAFYFLWGRHHSRLNSGVPVGEDV